jgi:hypothetical protein
VASVFLVAAALTVAPALALLFYLLRRYEGYFEDARVFFALIVGFFAGLVVAFLENVLFQFDHPSFVAAAGPAFAFSYFVVGYAFVETAAKTAVLGAGKFRRRKDTPYYGAALGVGFGAMLALQSVAIALQRGKILEQPIDATWVEVLLLLFALAAGNVLASGAAGVWVGRGSADGKLWNGLFFGTLVQMAVLLLRWFSPAPGAGVAVLPSVAALVYGVTVVVLAQRRILDPIVPPEIRDQVLKERRREQRKEMQ